MTSSWLSGIGRLLRAEPVAAPDPGLPLAEELEGIILGSPRRYTRAELAARTGMDDDEGRRLWRSLGFAEVPSDETLFTELDLTATEQLARLTEVGLLPPDVREAVARAVAQSMSRLAEWQIAMLVRLLESPADPEDPDASGSDPEDAHPRDSDQMDPHDTDPLDAEHREPDRAPARQVTREQALTIAIAALPALEELQNYVWRRHLAATLDRVLAAGVDCDSDQDTAQLAVGFADMVGFTRATRRSSPAELGQMIELFSSVTTEIIAEGHGRIVKTVGDEVLFVSDAIDDAAAIALALQERIAIEPALPELRIGLAAGRVLVRFGDVYGEVVNIASRLTSNARPGTTLIDREMAAALADDPRFTLRRQRPLAVRGYQHLHRWLLRPA